MRNLLLTALLVPPLAACQTSVGPSPEDAPGRIQLTRAPVEVLQVTFEATEAGYGLVEVSRVLGVPSRAIHEDRPVRITALDESGEPVHSISVFDPREVRTTGTRDPSTKVRASGTLILRFANPDSIRSFDVEVHEGPNAGLHARLPVDAVSPRQEPREPRNADGTRRGN